MFQYIRRDADLLKGVPIRKVLLREFQGCLSDIRSAFRYGVGLSKMKLSYWMLRYFAGKMFDPLNSTDVMSARLYVKNEPTTVVLRKSQSDIFTLREVFFQGLYDFPFHEVFTQVYTVVDLGANAGLSAAYFQARFPEVRIVCVEPIEENLRLIKLNCRASMGEWDVKQAAVSGADNPVIFFASEWWSSGTVVEKIVNSRRVKPHRLENRLLLPNREVAGVSIKTLIEKTGLSFIDLLKIDIEGAEEQIVETAGEWIEKIGMIMIEIHDKYIDGNRVRQCFKEHGFIQYPHQGDCEVFVHQDTAAKKWRRSEKNDYGKA